MSDLHELFVRWAQRTLGRNARVVSKTALKLKTTQKTWLLRVEQAHASTSVVLKTSPIEWYSGGPMTEEVVLPLAEELGLPAPRLLGVDVNEQAEVTVVLSTLLPGDSTLPAEAPLLRLRSLGSAAARLHAIPMSARPGLPHHKRPVPYDPYVPDRREGKAPTTALLEEADRVVSAMRPPDADPVLVHGDYHPGNTMWLGDAFVGYIDWDTAGVGRPGIDLGWCRLETALHYSEEAADQILLGWRDETGGNRRVRSSRRALVGRDASWPRRR
ncbi:aminoglycoside phosphotransferase family protein [Actinopolymorpha sp. B9G3]|uniref:phosphotransferase family protein n=1 Tax=Actinopolymorpha sp. B9G3 TaxID=3158970 RepID=UPI0032D8F5EA